MVHGQGGLSADFTLRQGTKFHNGDPVTSEDVKFSFERYRGGGAKILKDTVTEVQTPAPNRVRFVFKEPWPDFPAFYGTFLTSAGWVVPKKYVERVGEEAFRKAQETLAGSGLTFAHLGSPGYWVSQWNVTFQDLTPIRLLSR